MSRFAFATACVFSALFAAGCEPPPPVWLTELSCADGELAFATEENQGIIEQTECRAIPQTCPADGSEAWVEELPIDCIEDLCGTPDPSSMQYGIWEQPETDEEYVVVGCTP